ncbi:MAG: nuclear transport factor 2 family protein [Actinomycetes bacterium]
MTTETADVDPTVHVVAERLRSGYERQDAVGIGQLYADDATWELHVGSSHILMHGRSAIVSRYAQDLSLPPTLLRWHVRVAPWGAVVEAEAEQGVGRTRASFRWVHLLTIDQGRITGDVVHCTGALPVPAAG